jgi:hypothetical protein
VDEDKGTTFAMGFVMYCNPGRGFDKRHRFSLTTIGKKKQGTKSEWDADQNEKCGSNIKNPKRNLKDLKNLN